MFTPINSAVAYSRKRLLIATVFIVLSILLASVATSATDWFGNKLFPHTARSVIAVNPARQGKDTASNEGGPSQEVAQPIKAIRLTVTHLGFSPSELKVPAGLYILDVDNRTGGREIRIIVDSLDGNRIRGNKPIKGTRGHTSLYNLTPGDYAVGVAEAPNWIAKISVSAR
jgi:hypothetical protein